ncbi:spermidine synthase [Variovorax sp. J22R133]|uniref:spermine/spermidine synthase domain-containing protein n=1 Tax=Variovorax brevis TaxID=3053503 RepID=UPI002578E075|nr:spermidine synthase [Variovorax sp. J22R133]MDM0112254.1 spermidine synthase [Variovorax sp. J22R133]
MGLQDRFRRLEVPDDFKLKVRRSGLLTLAGDLAAMRVSQARPLRHRAALWLMVANGFAALACQLAWAWQLALHLGHDAGVLVAVATAMFAGVAAGALALGPVIHRSARPERWYVACAVIIAAWSLTLPLLMELACAWLLDIVRAPAPSLLRLLPEGILAIWQGAVISFGVFLLLLPATAAMGNTLPAMERVLGRIGREGNRIAALYACNGLGAAIGALAAVLWVIPQFGLARTAAMCALLNAMGALGALGLSSAFPAGLQIPGPRGQRGALALLTATGFLGMGYALLAGRVLMQETQGTVYTVGLLLALGLTGGALGATVYQRWLIGGSNPDRLRDRLLCLQAMACLVGIVALWKADALRQLWTLFLGAGAVKASDALDAVPALLLPAIFVGALLGHLNTEARADRVNFGRALGFNALGAAAAPVLLGALAVPAWGTQAALMMVAAGYLFLLSPRILLSPFFWLPACALAGLVAWMPTPAFINLPEGSRLLSHQESATTTVSVVADDHGIARLHINDQPQRGSNATVRDDARRALLPLLLHHGPQRALWLGLGTGAGAFAAAQDPTLQVDAVEVLPGIIEASTAFRPSAGQGAQNPRLHLIASDPGRHLNATQQRYDVIVSDNVHPVRGDEGARLTVEHMRAIRERLTEQGLFCQWLDLRDVNIDTLRSVVRTFLEVFPRGWALLATHDDNAPQLGLVSFRDASMLEIEQLRDRLANAKLPHEGIADEFELLGNFVAGPQALLEFAADAPINTDNRPIAAYQASRLAYTANAAPRERLLALLRDFTLEPGDLIDAGPDAEWSQRLASYWAARDRRIALGPALQAPADQPMPATVREGWTSLLRISPDFRPAYDALLHEANSLGRTDLVAANQLLGELEQLQPARTEAQRARKQLARAAQRIN